MHRAILALTILTAPLAAFAQTGPVTSGIGVEQQHPAISRHGLAMHGDLKYPEGFPYFDYVNPAAPRGGTLRQAVTGSFDTLNPHVVKGMPAYGLGYVFETLLTRSWDEPFSIYGLLASRVEMPDDRREITFHLNPAARWHDGSPVTAEDVLFSFDVQRRFGTPNRRQFYEKVALAQSVGDRAVRFVFLKTPDGEVDREMPLLMGLMPIHSRIWWRDRPFDQTVLTPPMGSGPYRISEVEVGRHIRYERVRDYWAHDLPTRRGLFNFDRLDFLYFRDDGVALEAFKAGQADVRRESDPVKWATGYEGPALRDGRIVRVETPHARPEFANGFIFNTRRAIFADRKVREALGYATDFNWIARNLFHGSLKRATGYYPNSELAARGLPDAAELAVLEPWRKLLDPALFTTPFTLPLSDGTGPAGNRDNRHKALQLLAEAGWTLKGGRLVNRAGKPFSFEILLSNPGDERIALEFARSAERLGMTVAVRVVDSAQFQSRLDSFDFDMTIRWWVSTLSPGNEQLYYFGSVAASQQGSRNYAGISDPVVDALASAIAKAPTRQELVTRTRALDRVLQWGYYMVPLFHSGVDRVARQSWVMQPTVQPLYGPLLDSWWRNP